MCDTAQVDRTLRHGVAKYALSGVMSDETPLADHRASHVSYESSGQRNLRIAGWVLIGVGVANGVGSLLFTVLRYSILDCRWLTSVIVLLFAFQTDPLKRVGRAAGMLMLLLWIWGRFNHLDWIPSYITSRIADDCLAFMLMILGVLILSTNDPNGQTRMLFRRWSSIVRTHRLKALAVCVAMVWIMKADHSHSMCLVASEVCEQHGAYDSAITLTELARDTFPPGYHDYHHEIAARIRQLRRYQHLSAESPSASAVEHLGNEVDSSQDALPTMIAR